jgi:uracil-DNA glycosylase
MRLEKLSAKMPLTELTLLIGRYAQRHFLGKHRKASLAETTRAWTQYAPRYIPLPHPSPRNTPWLQRNAGFEKELIPELRRRVAELLAR